MSCARSPTDIRLECWLPAPGSTSPAGRPTRRRSSCSPPSWLHTGAGYVILTSDNGYLLGEHRIRQGKTLPYEPSARVPLIIRGPGVPAGEVRTQPVAAIDVSPTVVGVSGAKPFLSGAVMDWRSLLPKVADPTRGADRDLVLEAGPEGDMQDYLYHGLRTADGWKYIEYHTGEQELYNLIRDPEELDNLAGDPGFATMQTYLAERLRQLEYCAGSDCP